MPVRRGGSGGQRSGLVGAWGEAGEEKAPTPRAGRARHPASTPFRLGGLWWPRTGDLHPQDDLAVRCLSLAGPHTWATSRFRIPTLPQPHLPQHPSPEDHRAHPQADGLNILLTGSDEQGLWAPAMVPGCELLAGAGRMGSTGSYRKAVLGRHQCLR